MNQLNSSRPALFLHVFALAAGIAGCRSSDSSAIPTSAMLRAGPSCGPATPPPDCGSIDELAPLHPGESGDPRDVVIRDCRVVPAGTFTFGNINIRRGGLLFFSDEPGTTNFYARSILVESGGAIKAGQWDAPFGCGGGQLTIGLWGGASDEAPAIACENDQCYPAERVGKFCDASDSSDPCQSSSSKIGDNAKFEGYAPLHGNGDFSRKTLAVSYGGSLELFGNKGVDPLRRDPDDNRDQSRACVLPEPAQQFDPRAWAAGSGISWARLAADVEAGATSLTLDRRVDWSAGDKVVLTTTDWHPSHSELLTLGEVADTQLQLATKPAHAHEGELFDLEPSKLTHDPGHANTRVDARAAVGLLSRSITIRSMGPSVRAGQPEPFPSAAECGPDKPANPDCYFGGHVVARQGFGRFQVQGVEFHQLGQGGMMGHYPVHFHLAKDTSYTNAFVTDSSIWESNTRFVTIHGTHGVEVARNVGYLSLGHAFYLEDGTEIGNSLCYNLGVSARAPFREYFAAQPVDSPTRRMIPPILDKVAIANSPNTDTMGSDATNPAMFWIMNADNDFVGNHAVGVHGVGVCYWPLNSKVGGPSAKLSWTPGYAYWNGIQGSKVAPLRRFRGNSCSTAAYAFMTERGSGLPSVDALRNAGLSPLAAPHALAQADLPQLSGNFPATRIGHGNCVSGRQTKADADACAVTIIDHFTTSFNWAETNVGSIWLRAFHYLFSNSAVTDQLYGGLGFVSGGSPEQAMTGQLALTYDSVFIGTTGDSNPDASPLGPQISASQCNGQFCSLPRDGVPYFSGAFQPKRMITIYDGPFYSDGSVFVVDESGQPPPSSSVYWYSNQPLQDGQPRVVDAGIGWKQPNGFYYPPVFGFRNSAFGLSSTRHNVVDQYADYSNMQPSRILGNASFTPIDTTTILNDLDGTLNGVKPTQGPARSSGLSNNHFYAAPQSVAECNSFGTVTIPHEFTSTFIAQLTTDRPPGVDKPGLWTNSSWMAKKPTVAVYRQYRMSDAAGERCTAAPGICKSPTEQACNRGTFFMGSSIGQAMGLTMRGGTYFIDTATATQQYSGQCLGATNVGYVPATFEAGQTYAVYQLFANSETAVTYQIYVGSNFDRNRDFAWVRVDPLATGNEAYAVEPVSGGDLGQPSLVNGVLTVTVDQGKIAGSFGFDRSDPLLCQPSDLCQPDPAQAKCVAKPVASGNAGLEALIGQVCEDWVTPAYAEVEGGDDDGLFLGMCPRGGCLGFSFRLPSGFVPKTYAKVGQPLSQCYPAKFLTSTMTRADADQCPLPTPETSTCKD